MGMMKTRLRKKPASASIPRLRTAVGLQCHAPEAKSLFVAGTFNDWRPDATPLQPQTSGLWTVELELAPGDYEYLFVVDGCWRLDPGANKTAPNPFGGRNAVLRVPRLAK
jgi:1,4-alpha-glucan branching enzyme